MRCGPLVTTTLLGMLVGQGAVGGRAQAAAPAAAPSPAPAAAPAPTPAPTSQNPPSPWELPPGSYYPPPAQHPGYAPPGMLPHLPVAIAHYESSKRSRGIALLIEWFIPGGGSIYGDHLRGAVMTWALMAAGVVLLVYGISGAGGYDSQTGVDEPADDDRVQFGVVGGLGLLLVGRTYGFVDAWRSTGRYNQNLRLRLGVPEQYSRDLHGPGGPRRLAAGPAFGPRLAFRF
jgi:hypothetical protein